MRAKGHMTRLITKAFDKNEFWVVEDEKEAEINYDDLENMLDEEELPIDLDSQTQPSEGQEFNEEDNVVQVDVAINVDHGDGDFDDDESDSQDNWLICMLLDWYFYLLLVLYFFMFLDLVLLYVFG